MSRTSTRISIAIFKGDPVDFSEFRHTGLLIRFANDSPATFVDIAGSHGTFEFQVQTGYDPRTTGNLAKLVEVGTLMQEISSFELINILEDIHIDNRDREFNCQTWVEKALRQLKDNGMLSPEAFAVGVDDMVDVIAEAEDQE